MKNIKQRSTLDLQERDTGRLWFLRYSEQSTGVSLEM
jgi:hypothetical protein